MKLLLVFALLSVVVFGERSLRRRTATELDDEEVHIPVETHEPWDFSVVPVEHLNRASDNHISQFPYFYSFCVPLQRLPVGPYTATLEFEFRDQTEEVVVDLDFNGRSYDFVSKDPVYDLKVPLHKDEKDVNGWNEKKGFSESISGRVYTKQPVTKVTFHGEGSWVEVHLEDLLCTGNHHHHENEEVSIPEPPKRHHSVSCFVMICIGLLLFFSSLMCCCTCASAPARAHDDIMTEMEQFTELIPEDQETLVDCAGDAYEDDDAVLRQVQEQSRREYEAQNQYSVRAQQEALTQYMQAPVMTPEAYANFLASRQ